MILPASYGHGERCAIREQFRQVVFEYIAVDYNRTRRHRANGYLSSMGFEALQIA
jgi:putative transposase